MCFYYFLEASTANKEAATNKEDYGKENEYFLLSLKKMVKDGIVLAENLLLEKDRNKETGNFMIRCLPCTVHAKKAKVIDAGSRNKAL